MDYSLMTDSELRSRLDDGILIAELESTEGWQVLNEQCKRAAEKAKHALLSIKATDTAQIIELQQIAKLYGSVLPSLLHFMKEESKIAFEELVDRGELLTK